MMLKNTEVKRRFEDSYFWIRMIECIEVKPAKVKSVDIMHAIINIDRKMLTAVCLGYAGKLGS